MLRYSLIILLAFAAGLAARALFDIRASEAYSTSSEQSAAVVVVQSADALVATKPVVPPGDLSQAAIGSSSNQAPWYQQDYRGNWQAMFATLDERDDNSQTSRIEFLTLVIKLLKLPRSEQFNLLEEAIAAGQTQICYHLMSNMAHQAPYAALSFLQSIDLAELSEGSAVMRGFIEGFIEYSPQEAWRWLQTPGDDNIKALAGDNLRNMEQRIVRNAARDPQQQLWALQAARESKDPQTIRIGEWIVTQSMMQSNRQQTMEFVINEYRQSNNKSLLNAALRSWARDNPENAANFMINNPDLMDAQNTSNLAIRLLRSNNQPVLDQLYANIQDERVKHRVAIVLQRYESGNP